MFAPYCADILEQIRMHVSTDRSHSWTLWFFWNFLECVFPTLTKVALSPDALRFVDEWVKWLVLESQALNALCFDLLPTILGVLVARTNQDIIPIN